MTCAYLYKIFRVFFNCTFTIKWFRIEIKIGSTEILFTSLNNSCDNFYKRARACFLQKLKTKQLKC